MMIEINQGALARQGATSDDIYDWLRTHSYNFKALTDPGEQYDILCTPFIYDNARTLGAEHPLTPWSDKAATLAHLRSLAAELKTYCTAPRYTTQVREVLKQARVIR